MEIVLLTALGIGGATALGAVIGFLARGFALKRGGLIMAFSSGIMLAASVIGLILPSLELGGALAPLVTVPALFIGALMLDACEKLLPDSIFEADGVQNRSLMLFVIAIAVHNLPEGLAAGVGFGTGDLSEALFIAGGIALQNIPEGMVIIAPMISAGISPIRALMYALATGAIEVFGTVVGYLAVSVSAALLPFILAFAGGIMIYVISCDVSSRGINGNIKCESYALMLGFSLMLVLDFLLF